MTSIVVASALLYSWATIIGAMMVIRYEKTSAPLTGDFIPCGISASDLEYCAARVTSDNTCTPLHKDWCGTKDTSQDGSYFIKREWRQVPEMSNVFLNLHVFTYRRVYRSENKPAVLGTNGETFEPNTYITVYSVPINVTDGNEVEIKFIMRNGTESVRWDFRDNNDNTVIRTHLEKGKGRLYSYWMWSNTTNQLNREGYLNNGDISFSYYVIYKLRLVCNDNAFKIYFDDEYMWSYVTTLPISSITTMRLKFRNG